MPSRRSHHDEHSDNQHKKPTAQVRQAVRQVAPMQLMAEEAVWEGNLEGQAEILANLQLLTAQRSSLAVQIAHVQGNRHLGQVLSAAGLNGQTAGSNGRSIQRQGVRDPDEPYTEEPGPEETALEEPGSEESGYEEPGPGGPGPEESGYEEPGPEGPGPGVPSSTHPTIRFGSQGSDVMEAQTKLNSAGANPPLEVDGIFGSLTRAAVVDFQSSKDLSPDGIVGPLTWDALDRAGPGPDMPVPIAPPERWSEEDRARLATQTSDTGTLTVYQASRAELRVYALSDAENSALRSLLDRAASDMEWAFLLKAAAAQRAISDITIFADRIRGMSERWLMRNLMAVDLANEQNPGQDPEERGIMQQYGNSCGPTSMQLIHAQADPIYALELRSAGPIDQAPPQAVSNPETIANQQLAGEQAAILNAHAATGAGGTPANRENPPNTPVPGGAWVESDINALASATGVTYTTQLIGTGITLDNAISTLHNGLDSGVQVPIIVGGGMGPSNTSHYVVVLAASEDRFLVHDVYTGQTVWRFEAQFRHNTLALPSGWNFFVGIDVPSLVPPPLPQPSTPSSG
jgi:hypothetical protein